MSHEGTDMMSFKFTRSDNQQQNHYLNYKAGQYSVVDLGTEDDPEGPMRSFTIASSPTEEKFILISTRIRDTPFKKKLANLDLVTLVNFTAPLGKFVLHEDDNSSLAVFLSGGIGVTPFRSMIKYATDKVSPIKIMIFDSNRNQENILYREEFDECLSANKNLKIIYTITGAFSPSSSGTAYGDWKGERGYINKAMVTKYLTSDELDNSIFYICGPPGMLNAMQKLLMIGNDWKGEYGRIDKAMILKYVDTNVLNNSIFYICGPPGMLKAMQTLLQEELEIPKERIKIEEFTGY